MKNKTLIIIILLSIGYPLKVNNCYSQWVVEAIVSSNDLYAVKFVNPNTAYVVGENQTIAKSSNGGENWIIQNSGTIGDLLSVDFLNESTGFAGGQTGSGSGVIYKTTNGGNNWLSIIIDSVMIMSIHFINSNTGYAGGWGPIYDNNLNKKIPDRRALQNSLLYFTTNAGNNWSRIDISNVYEVSDLSFINANTGWGAGWSMGGERLIKTSNGGNNWSLIWTGGIYDIFSIYFVNANSGWITGDRIILKTTNGGNNWFYQINYNTYGIHELYESYFIDENTGWVVGDAGTILKTTNSGDNWGTQASPYGNWLWDVYFIDSLTGWTVGGQGRILKTTNGGGPIGTIGIKPIRTEIPAEYSLYQNYPNPFNPETKIKFDVPKYSNVKIVIFDILGREIQTIVNESLQAGTYETEWNASAYPSGVYLYRIRAGDFVSTQKMALVK